MPRTIYVPRGANPQYGSGISLTYYTTLREVEIAGWYDSFVGIEGERMPLGAFLARLGITLQDCERALQAQERTP